MTRDDVIKEAMSWLGTPYHHMAQVKGAGVDCGQLLCAVYHAVGLCPEIELGQYPNDWHFHRNDEQYLKHIMKYCKPTDKPRKGDIVLFKFARCISHGGIIDEMPYVIHAHVGMGVIRTSIYDAELAGRVAGYFTVWED